MDAAIAALFVNAVVNPQSAGLGGGFHMTVYDPATGVARCLDARETAPAAATKDMYAGRETLAQLGAPLPRFYSEHSFTTEKEFTVSILNADPFLFSPHQVAWPWRCRANWPDIGRLIRLTASWPGPVWFYRLRNSPKRELP